LFLCFRLFQVNCANVVRLLFERREPKFSAEEHELYRNHFKPAGVSPHLMSVILEHGQWHRASQGQAIVQAGRPLTRVLTIHSGSAGAFPAAASSRSGAAGTSAAAWGSAWSERTAQQPPSQSPPPPSSAEMVTVAAAAAASERLGLAGTAGSAATGGSIAGTGAAAAGAAAAAAGASTAEATASAHAVPPSVKSTSQPLPPPPLATDPTVYGKQALYTYEGGSAGGSVVGGTALSSRSVTKHNYPNNVVAINGCVWYFEWDLQELLDLMDAEKAIGAAIVHWLYVDLVTGLRRHRHMALSDELSDGLPDKKSKKPQPLQSQTQQPQWRGRHEAVETVAAGGGGENAVEVAAASHGGEKAVAALDALLAKAERAEAERAALALLVEQLQGELAAERGHQ
jgi:hypothetical protein